MAIQPRSRQTVDPVFDRDKFLLRQKHMSLSEKYYVWDEQNESILFVERPPHIGRNILSLFGGLISWGVVIWLFVMIAGQVEDSTNKAVLVGVGIVVGLIVCIIVAVALSPYRHTTIYRNDTKTEPLLVIKQLNKFHVLKARYEIRRADDILLATLQKNMLYDAIRKRWYCYSSDGSILCVVKEDSILKSVLRRALGPLFGALRTNFVFMTGTMQENVIGQFNREFTILDRYVLDMTMDPDRTIDRQIAIAIGVMLDTGERR